VGFDERVDHFPHELSGRFQYSECGLLAPYTSAGKPVFEAEYSSQPSSYCPPANAADTNAVRFDLDLKGAARITCR